MTEALAAVVHHAFAALDLSRIEAACLPENVASRALLDRTGFRYEGVAESYLQINGRWRNHVLYANLRGDRRGARAVTTRDAALEPGRRRTLLERLAPALGPAPCVRPSRATSRSRAAASRAARRRCCGRRRPEVAAAVRDLRRGAGRRSCPTPAAPASSAGRSSSDGPLPVILSVERLNRIRDLDLTDDLLVAEAGCVLADVQAAARDAGRLFPLSLASEGSARIGGLLGTNAGGVDVLRYGNARDLCLGVEAVLADGRVLHGLGRLVKDNMGYDLRHLLIGCRGHARDHHRREPAALPRARRDRDRLGRRRLARPRRSTLLAALRDALGGALSAFELINVQGLAFLAETHAAGAAAAGDGRPTGGCWSRRPTAPAPASARGSRRRWPRRSRPGLPPTR